MPLPLKKQLWKNIINLSQEYEMSIDLSFFDLLYYRIQIDILVYMTLLQIEFAL